MNRLLNQSWWLVNLGALTIMAFLSAKVANHVVAGEIIALPTKAAAARAMTSQRPASQSHSDWSLSISERNLFNATPPEEIEPGEGGDKADEALKPSGEIPGPYDECDPAKVGLSLVATMVVDPPTESRAVFQASQKGEHMLKTGAEVEGGVSVAAIYRERAVIVEGGRYSCLKLGEKAAGGARGGKPAWSPGKPSPARPASSSRASSADSERIKAGIQVKEDGRVQVDKGMLDEQLEKLDVLAQQARVTPFYKNGKQQGFKVARVKRGSLYEHLGLQRGDVLLGVNGQDLTSPNKALSLLDQLGTARDVTVNIERRGKPTTIEFNIR
ncbi:PDZ domain-containing protein [Myxococcota bacterium]|nr:PDZ domain-containing protein [Myxococcota bacterium]MBU1897702.1 PDZ domain-containing protein [Myxococcota bacterium]